VAVESERLPVAMRVGLVHSFYRASLPSGENAMVNQQLMTLREAGHDVRLLSRDSPEGVPLQNLAGMAVRVASHRGPNPLDNLGGWRPDILHVHNLFPNFGYSWISACSIPIVTTLHNYRPICANGMLFRDGRPCEDCLRGGSWHSVLHRCYRGSVSASIPMALRNRNGVEGDPLLSNAARIVVLSEMSWKWWRAAGIDARRMRVVPNCLEEAADLPGSENREGWVVVSRLTPEKGVLELIREWPSKGAPRLSVVGDGPLRRTVEQACAARPGVNYVGPLDQTGVGNALRGSVGLVIPSLCFENLPTVMLEATRAGCGVMARQGNVAAQFVRAHGGGEVYAGVNDLAGRVADWDVQKHSDAARGVFASEFTQKRWLERMVVVYEEALA
jgi:glycosyltransferase involved in cell wall biosynthesis